LHNFFQHTPAVRQCCCVVWLDFQIPNDGWLWLIVVACCLNLKFHPLLGTQYSMALLANHHRRRCWLQLPVGSINLAYCWVSTTPSSGQFVQCTPNLEDLLAPLPFHSWDFCILSQTINSFKSISRQRRCPNTLLWQLTVRRTPVFSLDWTSSRKHCSGLLLLVVHDPSTSRKRSTFRTLVAVGRS
jgi:hypothetical protein